MNKNQISVDSTGTTIPTVTAQISRGFYTGLPPVFRAKNVSCLLEAVFQNSSIFTPSIVLFISLSQLIYSLPFIMLVTEFNVGMTW